MFALQYGDHFLEILNPEQVVTRWVSTAFNEPDKLIGSGSVLSFDLAPTPANHARMGYANQLASRLARKDIEVTVWLFGMPWKRCLFTFDLKDGLISGYTKIDHSVFADVIKEKELPAVFVKTKNGAFVDHEWVELGGSGWESIHQAIFDSLTPGTAAYTFFPYINTTLFGDYSGEDGSSLYTQPRVINPWANGAFPGISINPDEIKSTWYTPFFSLAWVIKKACTYLGFEAVGDIFDDPLFNSLVIDNSAVYNMQDVTAADSWKIAPARHLPRIKLNDFFKYLRENYRIIYYFNSDTKQAHFSSSDSVLSSPERIDLDGCIEKARPTTKKNPETGYELVQGIDPDDELFEVLPYVKSYFIGGDRVQKKIEVPIGTCFMHREINVKDLNGAIWRIPMKKQLGNAYSAKALNSSAHNPEDYGRNKFSLRVLSYRGMMADSLGNGYPYATSDGLAPDEETEICPSLWLGGSNGMLENYHRKWYTFLIRSELITLKAYLTTFILSILSPIRKIRFPTNEGVFIEALMDQVEFSGSKDRLLKCELQVYPNYNTAGADDAINTDFVSGVVENPPGVYCWLETVWVRDEYRRPFLGKKVLLSTTSHVVARFYSDAGKINPVEVNGLVINVVREYQHNGHFNTFNTQHTCWGTTENIFLFQQTYYQKGSETTNVKFVLADGDGYLKVI